MYWVDWGHPDNASIYRSWMDGSHRTQIVAGLKKPYDVAVDFEQSRLLWTLGDDDRIGSSGMEGQNVQISVQAKAKSRPVGIGVHKGRIYWTTNFGRSLQSSNSFGKNIQVLFTDTRRLHRLVVVPGNQNLNSSRRNDCENHKCANVCALTPKSFACVQG